VLIGEILVEKGYCKPEDIEKALEIQKSYGGRIGTILLNMGVITEDKLLDALSDQFKYPFKKEIENIEKITLPVNWELLSRFKVLPIKEKDNVILVATNDPLNVEIFSLIESLTGKRIKVILTTEESLKYIENLYTENISVRREDVLNLDEEIEKLKELASEAPVIKLVNAILNKAVEYAATDIHFESYKKGMVIRFRMDGILRKIETISDIFKLAVITRLKLMSGMNIAEKRLPQDGRIGVKIGGKELDIRASSIPTQYGESFVLRLLGREDITYSIEKLGFYDDQVELIKKISDKPNGIFLTTGPTGSGKTTTLYSILSRLNSESVKILTVEDPVEYELKGINQIQVNPDIGFSFATALRSILRQDPDIIMIGEIRDKETAEIAIQAALTGHLVLSTLHTNSALSSIARLLDMGVEFYLLKSTIVGLMAQRLVRKLCPYCSEPVSLDSSVIDYYNLNYLREKYKMGNFNPKEARGCRYCNYTGYKGRTVIAEVVPFNEKCIKYFEKNKSFDDPSKLGYRSMLEDGLLKVIEGITTLAEVIRVIS